MHQARSGQLSGRPVSRCWWLFSGSVRRFFDSVAVGWDERVRSDSPEYLEPLVATLDRLEASRGRILDIGTGTGAALKLADRYPDAEVVGIDISAEMVAQAKAADRTGPVTIYCSEPRVNERPFPNEDEPARETVFIE